MAKDPSEEQMYEEASKRVRERKRFYNGLATYAVVNAVLVVIWALSGRGYPWFLWPLGIWGVFVIGDYLRIFVFGKGSDEEGTVITEPSYKWLAKLSPAVRSKHNRFTSCGVSCRTKRGPG